MTVFGRIGGVDITDEFQSWKFHPSRPPFLLRLSRTRILSAH